MYILWFTLDFSQLRIADGQKYLIKYRQDEENDDCHNTQSFYISDDATDFYYHCRRHVFMFMVMTLTLLSPYYC